MISAAGSPKRSSPFWRSLSESSSKSRSIVFSPVTVDREAVVAVGVLDDDDQVLDGLGLVAGELDRDEHGVPVLARRAVARRRATRAGRVRSSSCASRIELAR